MRRTALALIVVLGLLAGCGAAPKTASSTSPKPVALPTNQATAGLQQQAALAACPSEAHGGKGALPDVTVACLGGPGAVRLAHLTGTPMIVNLWASWCEPCYKEIPAIQQVYAAAGPKLRVLGVDTSDDPNRALHTAIETGMHYPSVYDPGRKVAAGLGQNVQPVTVFVRADGTIAHVQVGAVRDAAALRALVRQYLGVALEPAT